MEARVALVARGGHLLRAWRIHQVGYGLAGAPFFTPELVSGDPVVLANVGRKCGPLRLGAKSVAGRVVLRREIYGGTVHPDVRFGPDGRLYQPTTSRTTGAAISR